jgi:hypothetical protein
MGETGREEIAGIARNRSGIAGIGCYHCHRLTVKRDPDEQIVLSMKIQILR